jgi:hypothetical protein
MLVSAALNAPATAQESINMPAATQPSQGKFVLRNQFRYLEAREHPLTGDDRIRQYTVWNNLAYGITGELSVNLSLPITYRSFRDADTGGRKNESGFDDITAMLKWRIWQDDFGPIDTRRVSLIGGMQFPTGNGDMTSDGFNPIIGAVFTQVHGRHGINAALQYKFNTGRGTTFNLGGGNGRADALLYDTSYLYRISPAEYAPETLGAWYALIELNGVYETNGDNELSLTPGIMYEARTWTIEAGVRIPVWNDLDRRPETRFEVIAGLRLLF